MGQIDVGDFQGRGEFTPTPHFFQNLGEAEYAVALFMVRTNPPSGPAATCHECGCVQYLRLCGWPAERISILSTYNGQKHLIRDVLRKRCAWTPLFGMPARVTTVDRYQGQQVRNPPDPRPAIRRPLDTERARRL